MDYLRVALFTTLILCASTRVCLADVKWSSPAMACVPTSTTAEEARYITTAGRVKFKDDAPGSLSFICPVSNRLPDGRYAVAGMVNLTSPNYSGLKFALRRVERNTGNVET